MSQCRNKALDCCRLLCEPHLPMIQCNEVLHDSCPVAVSGDALADFGCKILFKILPEVCKMRTPYRRPTKGLQIP